MLPPHSGFVAEQVPLAALASSLTSASPWADSQMEPLPVECQGSLAGPPQYHSGRQARLVRVLWRSLRAWREYLSHEHRSEQQVRHGFQEGSAPGAGPRSRHHTPDADKFWPSQTHLAHDERNVLQVRQ